MAARVEENSGKSNRELRKREERAAAGRKHFPENLLFMLIFLMSSEAIFSKESAPYLRIWVIWNIY